MAQVLSALVLLMMTIIPTVTANTDQCVGKSFFQPCGDGGRCVCPNLNKITELNPSKIRVCSVDTKFVCKRPECLSVSGRFLDPKRTTNGDYLHCNDDTECGNHFKCTFNLCCPVYQGKFSRK
ncbi:uncharacterized protein LOC132715797 [Ruditapes philippinarum]|uniref:uncharacterized protein LOC132715797 n=1 Tax=Ruditapes philippinarum TaxID=129788 RepID=UPI00295C2B7E|nr:uncharacterized protein LOC132715797 [Ruditapes philippinarum]